MSKLNGKTSDVEYFSEIVPLKYLRQIQQKLWHTRAPRILSRLETRSVFYIISVLTVLLSEGVS